MAGLDARLAKYPGSPGFKVFVAVSTILVVTGYPIYRSTVGGKQGEHYFSQERPEQIVKAQERSKREYREKRKAWLEEQKKLEQQQQGR
ncbi:expressed unknown protein [Seminavis robusta]|uniref:Uncharacterized protein n=1 Tax=Seminavis robusta TaxID=568900 RepID=A0A9N8EJ68_9STRA|nr:expressed unknown protein [Seminavis robusta]|eukprot:Sro1289_g259660.1 n/a (89) ;mRNA; f:7772-8267